jgi:SNF2 family DNA or RNA helicase
VADVKPLRYNYKTKPRRYQEQALMKTYQLGGRIGLFMPMRTGKSKVAIDWAGISHYNFGVNKVLIVCHNAGLDTWPKEIVKHCPVESRIWVLDKSSRANAGLVYEAQANEGGGEVLDWMIVNYEMVWRVLEKKVNKADNVTLDKVIASIWQPDLIISDEAHRLKWPTTETSMAMARLGQAARMKLALTGTPVTKWPLDVFGLFRFVNSDIFDIGRSAWKNFRARYGVWGKAAYAAHAEVLLRLQNEQELVGKIHANSFRIKLEDAIPELPERIVQNITVRMSPEAQRMYREMAQEMITDVAGKKATAKIILEKTLRLSTLTGGWVKDTEGVIHDIDDAKLKACMELVEDMIEQDEKVIVFAHYRHDYERIYEALQKRKINAVLHAGSEVAKTTARERFQRDPATRVFVSQTATGSLGLDLSAARMIIFYSWDHRWDTYTQAFERTFMPGKTDALGVYHLVVPSSIDGVKLRAIRTKGDMADMILFHPERLTSGEDDEDEA